MDALKKWMFIRFTPYVPNHHPFKMDILPKTFVHIFLAAKWLVRHSCTSPKHQRRPLPSLLLYPSSMAGGLRDQPMKNLRPQQISKYNSGKYNSPTTFEGRYVFVLFSSLPRLYWQ